MYKMNTKALETKLVLSGEKCRSRAARSAGREEHYVTDKGRESKTVELRQARSFYLIGEKFCWERNAIQKTKILIIRTFEDSLMNNA